MDITYIAIFILKYYICYINITYIVIFIYDLLPFFILNTNSEMVLGYSLLCELSRTIYASDKMRERNCKNYPIKFTQNIINHEYLQYRLELRPWAPISGTIVAEEYKQSRAQPRHCPIHSQHSKQYRYLILDILHLPCFHIFS